MNYTEVRKIYEVFQNMTSDEYIELMELCQTQEEQEFFTKMTDFFLQKKQEEIIRQPFKL